MNRRSDALAEDDAFDPGDEFLDAASEPSRDPFLDAEAVERRMLGEPEPQSQAPADPEPGARPFGARLAEANAEGFNGDLEPAPDFGDASEDTFTPEPFDPNAYPASAEAPGISGEIGVAPDPEDLSLTQPIPRIAIHAFCENPETGQLIHRAGEDRRLSKAHVTVELQGLAHAIERFHDESTPELLIIETGMRGRELFHQLDELASVCDADTKVVIVGAANGELRSKRLLNSVTKWAYKMEGAVQGAPVRLTNGLVGAVSAGGEVLVADAFSGASISGPVPIFGGIDNEPVSDGYTMYVASLDHSVYAFDATSGARRWRVRPAAPIIAQPTVYDGSLYVSTAAGLTSLNARNGDEQWVVEGLDARVVSMVRGDLLAFSGEELLLIDPGSGSVVDRRPSGSFSEIRADGFDDATLYAIGRRGEIARFVVR